MRRKWRPDAVPSSTIEVLLTPVPVEAGAVGTVPGLGQRTSSEMSPSLSLAPVARVPRGGPCPSALSHACQPGPAPRIPGSNTRPTR